MSDEKLTALALEVQQLKQQLGVVQVLAEGYGDIVQRHTTQIQESKSDCLANASKVSELEAHLIALSEMIEDSSVH